MFLANCWTCWIRESEILTGESNRFASACSYEWSPRTGDLVIFPSWLVHWVTPYQSDRPRLSVSFNAR